MRDFQNKNRIKTKQEYRKRVRQVMKSGRSTTVAKNIMAGYKKKCKTIFDLGGAAAKKG